MYTQCLFCKNQLLANTCFAFPKGIPEDIIMGDFIHTKVYPKQKNDIVFESVEEEEN